MFHVLLCLLTNVERRKRSTFFFKFYCVSLLKNKIVLVNALRAGLWLKWRECKTLRERWGKMYLTTNHRHDSLSSNTLPHTQQTFSRPRSHVPIAQAKTGDGIIDCNVSGKFYWILKRNVLTLYWIHIHIYYVSNMTLKISTNIWPRHSGVVNMK